MFTFFLQTQDILSGGHLSFFLIFFLFVWVVWVIKAIASKLYEPYEGKFEGTAAVIIPVLDEEPAFFESVLRPIINQTDNVLVVINGPRNIKLENLCDELGVRWKWEQVASKRNAIVSGAESTESDIVVLVDSDTIWEEDTLEKLLIPFSDEQIGGVTTQQSIYSPSRTFWTRLSNYLEALRTLWGSPAYSAMGTVGCLPGRTIAFRREIIERNAEEFLTDVFLGIHLDVSDDRTLTNYALKEGYETVYQSTSIVETDAPLKAKKWIKQQYRWAKGSQYNTMRMMPYMLKNFRKFWLLILNYSADILIPLGLVVVWIDSLISIITQQSTLIGSMPLPLLVFAGLGGLFFGTALRHLPFFKENPKEALYLIPFMLVLTFVMPFIRIYGLIRMGYNDSWGTRKDDFKKDTERSLLRFVPPAITAAILLVATILVILLLH